MLIFSFFYRNEIYKKELISSKIDLHFIFPISKIILIYMKFKTITVVRSISVSNVVTSFDYVVNVILLRHKSFPLRRLILGCIPLKLTDRNLRSIFHDPRPVFTLVEFSVAR